MFDVRIENVHTLSSAPFAIIFNSNTKKNVRWECENVKQKNTFIIHLSNKIWANTCLLFYLRLFKTKIRWIILFDLILLQRHTDYIHTCLKRAKVLSTSFIQIFYVSLLLSFNIFRKLIQEICEEEWTQWYEHC